MPGERPGAWVLLLSLLLLVFIVTIVVVITIVVVEHTAPVGAQFMGMWLEEL
jgi:hypothetical protein